MFSINMILFITGVFLLLGIVSSKFAARLGPRVKIFIDTAECHTLNVEH